MLKRGDAVVVDIELTKGRSTIADMDFVHCIRSGDDGQ